MIDYKAEQDDYLEVSRRGRDKLDSWKEIAVYLDREVRTVQRWEKQEGLPVHRHHHDRLGTVYAYRSELDDWLKSRQQKKSERNEKNPGFPIAESDPQSEPEPQVNPQIVETLSEASALESVTSRPVPQTVPLKLAIVLAAAAAVLIVAAAFVWRQSRADHKSAVVPGTVTIAVPPFQNLGGSADWFSEGLAEELAVQLERMEPSRVRVIGRTSSALLGSGGKNLEAASRDLAVDYMMQGTVRRENDHARITVQLLRIKDNCAVWADAYDRDTNEFLGAQTDVGVRIAQAVSAKLLGDGALPTDGSITSNSAAYEAYLKGRYEWHKGTEPDTRKSLQFYEQARDLDPNFAQAYAGIAEAYVMLAANGAIAPSDCYPKAEQAVQKALSLKDSLADAHVALGQIKSNWKWDWSGAESEFLKALDLAPGLATAHYAYAHFLSQMGRHDQAIAEEKRAQELEPLSAIINSDLGWFYFRARRYDEAIAECRKVLELEPGFQSAEYCMIRTLTKQHKLEEARATALQFAKAHNRLSMMPGLNDPRPENALRNLDKDNLKMMVKQRHSQYVSSYGFARLYADLGDRAQALEWLKKGFETRDRSMVLLKVDPFFDEIRDDPQFQDLVKRVGLPGNA